MSTANSPTRRAAPSRNWGLWIILSGVALVVIGVLVMASAMLFGQIVGEEFSPDTFDRRAFYYCEIPIVRLQITPITRRSTRMTLENHLTTNKLVPVNSTPKPRWDLVRMTHVKPQSEKCDARILMKYLDSGNDVGDPQWLTWTKEHPDLAKVLWPAVAKVAQQQLYIFVPDLVDAARLASDPTKFQTEVENVLARKYREFARLQQDLGRHEDAVTLFTESLAHDARGIDALRGRAMSLDALGESEKSAADVAEAERLTTSGSQKLLPEAEPK